MRDWIVHTLGGGATALAILVAIIGLTGALGGAVVSYIIGHQTVYVNAITVQRMKWVDTLRTNLSELLTRTTILRNRVAVMKQAAEKGEPASYASDEMIRDFTKMNDLENFIRLQLNPAGPIDQNILTLLRALSRCVSRADLDPVAQLEEALTAHAQWLLKAEWERIKNEARNPLSRLLHRRDQKRLLDRYQEYAAVHGRMPLARRLAAL